MIQRFRRLSFKVSVILIGFSVLAIAAIGLTLLVSWKLQGGATAINDMGRERMRSYRIAGVLSELVIQGSPTGDAIARAVADAALVFKLHLVLGMTLFLVFPFSRLVHIWSGFGAVSYLFRSHQVVRAR